MKSKSTRVVVIAITIITLIGLINIIPGHTMGKEITKFDNGGGKSEIMIKLGGEQGVFSDSTAYFSVPVHKGSIQEASLDLICSPDEDGNTLLNPRLDVGIDGDYEWKFTGSGYGAINHQKCFSTGIPRKVIAIGKKLTTNTTSIYLPKSAQVSEASMTLKGGDLEKSEVYIGVYTYAAQPEIYYIKSNNDRTFGTPSIIGLIGTNWPQSNGIGLGDFDKDGDYDIVANEGTWSGPNTGNIYLLEKTGSGNNFAGKTLVGTTGNRRNSDFAVGDFNNDKRIDFIVSEMNQNLYYFKNIYDGNFKFNKNLVTNSFPGGSAMGKDTADFNLDENLDFVVGGSAAGTVFIFDGIGDGTFHNPVSAQAGTRGNTNCVIAGDYNTDGNPDVIAKDSSTWPLPRVNFQLIPGKGDLTFKDPIDLGFEKTNWRISGDGYDFDFDGNQDFVVIDGSSIYCYWGKGDGSFEENPTTISVPSTIQGIATPPSEVLGGCNNMTIDIGEDGDKTPNFHPVPGPFNTEEEIEFEQHLNNLLSSPSPSMRTFTDDYGNTLYEIPIKFEADEIGNVLLKNLSIKYSYTAKVDKNPHNTHLVNELNDLIPKAGTGEFKVYFKITSDSPGKVKLTNLKIKFNEAPTFENIPGTSMDEGSDQFQLINLAQYFKDVEDLPEKLKYSVYSFTNNDYLGVSISNNHYLHVNATVEPDWHGETNIIIDAEDSDKGITRSNLFKVTINPVNDPPRIGIGIPNVELRVNTIHDKFDLDDPNLYYFYDVDSPAMFFRAIINTYPHDKFDEYLKLSINNDTNVLKIQSFNKYQKEIPVRIYCSDTEAVRTMKLSDLANIPTYQDFLVNITQFGISKKPTFPPKWKDIEDVILNEDEILINWINLNNYTTDPDDTPESLRYTIESLTNSAFINVYVTTSKDNTKNLLSIIPEPNFDGTTTVVIRAEDDDHNYALEEFKIIMIPSPDLPTVEILMPVNNSIVAGLVTISGNAFDAENELEKVEIKIGYNQWTDAKGLAYWSYRWDSTEYTTTIDNITIQVRAGGSGNRTSEPDTIVLQIDNARIDSDKDNVFDIYDAFPNDPTEWVDSDGDGVGDNIDRFPNDPTQWEDADGDGYGDNPSGNSPDLFPLDPTQWEDTDGDGYGDNPNGNNPDHYPEDENRHSKEGEQQQEALFTSKNLIWLIIIPFIIIDIMILIHYEVQKKRFLKK